MDKEIDKTKKKPGRPRVSTEHRREKELNRRKGKEMVYLELTPEYKERWERLKKTAKAVNNAQLGEWLIERGEQSLARGGKM